MSAPKSTLPFYGQAWELVVGYQGKDGKPIYETISTNEWEPEALHITFEVQQATLKSPWWYADICIYNLSTEAIQSIIFNAVWVTLKAGFQSGPTLSGTIWDGPILQVMYDQENVVDQRITLHCQANPIVMNQGVVSFSLGKFATQAQMLSKTAELINLPPIDQKNGTLSPYAQNALNAKAYPRGNTVFGKIGNFLDIVSNDQGLQTFRDGKQAYMTDLGQKSDGNPTPQFTFSPPNPPGGAVPPDTTPTIIGTPQQTQEGVIFTVLLDPRLWVQLPPIVVQLIRTLPSQLAIQPSTDGGNMSTPLNANLCFYLSQVKHIGDSRGNSWYTEVTGFSTLYAQSLIDAIAGPSGRM